MLNIYVTVEGLEQIALGYTPHTWHYNVRELDTSREGETLIGNFIPNFPERAKCIEPVMAKLKAKEAEIQAEAFKDLQAIKERRNNLLMLENGV